ncbi:MAG: hypothetical protein SX243_08125 [Acidobacteriota bacterium]|nr:hypothetical protein [Acidobacteriota bacterium]
MSTNDRTISLLTTILGAVAALVAVLTVGIFLQGWTQRQMAEEERGKIFERPYPELEAYQEEQQQKLTADYHWIDQEAGTVHLPIERAMALVLEEQVVDEQAGTIDAGPSSEESEEPEESREPEESQEASP